MKCVGCGAECDDGVRFCSMCGKPVTPPAVTPGAVETRHCVGCGRAMSWDANVCQYCGYDYRFKPRTTKLVKEKLITGSILTILAGILSIAILTIMIALDGDIGAESWAMAVMVYICAFLGIMGGIVAMMRISYPFAVLGAACSIVGPAFFFGIPALILIAQSSAEFERQEAM
jgi:hypothetical protein